MGSSLRKRFPDLVAARSRSVPRIINVSSTMGSLADQTDPTSP